MHTRDQRQASNAHEIIILACLMCQSDESNVEYLLTNGLNDLLIQVLQANDPGRPFFSLKVDTVVNRTLNNLLNCGASAVNLSESFIDGGS
jgi:hypothetical protein